jgi:hypothetical protein
MAAWPMIAMGTPSGTEIIDQAGAKSGKYNVTIKDSKGVQVGDGNVQVNNF